MRKFILKLIPVLFAGLFSLTARAEYLIIAHPEVGNLSQQAIERIFLAKTKTLPDGQTAVPVNQKEGSAIRVAFDLRINGKDEAQMKSYWAKLIFTGKAVPIRQLENDQEVIDFVASHPGAIGYIAADNVNDSVKGLFGF